jgi:hypothetical protein
MVSPQLLTREYRKRQLERKMEFFTKGIDRESVYPKLTLVGDTALAEHVLKLVAIVG